MFMFECVCVCVRECECVRVRQETVVSLALQCLQTGNVCPRQKGRNPTALHGKHWERSLMRAYTGADILKHTLSCSSADKKKRNLTRVRWGIWYWGSGSDWAGH